VAAKVETADRGKDTLKIQPEDHLDQMVEQMPEMVEPAAQAGVLVMVVEAEILVEMEMLNRDMEVRVEVLRDVI
jgi:tRNA1(Val) A37 N6-methylase TrmN6